MVQIEINTTQNVNINFTAASIGQRILAFFIDLLIMIAYSMVMNQLLKIFGVYDLIDDMDGWSQSTVITLFYLPVVFYSLIFETLLDGQSPGKRIMKIQVVKIDGYQASLPDFVMRWFFRLIDVYIMFGITAIISIITSKHNQRLGDMTAGTGVIALKNDITIDHTILENISETYIPRYPNVIKLSDNDARIIKDTFMAANKAKEFISTILKDYSYYTQNM